MAAGEDQPEPVVGNRLGVHHVGTVVERAERGLVGERVAARRGPPRAAQPVERAPPRRREKPGARAIRQAVGGPVAERVLEGLLDDLLRRVDVAHDAEDGGDDARVLDAEHLRHARTRIARRHRPGVR